MASGVITRVYTDFVRSKAAVWLSIIAIFIVMTASSWAAPMDNNSQRDFSFYFSVKGYQANKWFAEPSAIALDERNGLIYVADQKAGTVSAFSLQGVAKFQYGEKAKLKAPIGLAIDSSGNVYVSENDSNSIKIINSKGDVSALDIPADKSSDKEIPKPGRMTIDRDGNLYVIDRANCQIVVFDKNRKLKFRFGSIGTERGEFKLLQDVAVDRQGKIYAADAMGVPVQVFDRSGAYISQFGNLGGMDKALSLPMGLFTDRHDQIWVIDKANHRLNVFDRSGMFLKSFGSFGQGEGNLFYPIDAAQDSFGRVYVLESGTRRLQVFSLGRPFEPFSL